MPELIGEPLAIDTAKKLRDWLRKPEAQTLRTVIGAKFRLAQEEALLDGMKADGSNGYGEKATLDLKKASRYATALNVIEEIANPETPLETIKLKP